MIFFLDLYTLINIMIGFLNFEYLLIALAIIWSEWKEILLSSANN
jgi:hypothetical protein